MTRSTRLVVLTVGAGAVAVLVGLALRSRSAMQEPQVTRASTTPAREQSIVQSLVAQTLKDPTLLQGIQAGLRGDF